MAPVAETLSPDGTTAQEAVKCSDDFPSTQQPITLANGPATAAAIECGASASLYNQPEVSTPYADDASLLSPVTEEPLHPDLLRQDGAGGAADGIAGTAADVADEYHPAEHAATNHEEDEKLDDFEQLAYKHRALSGAGGVHSSQTGSTAAISTAGSTLTQNNKAPTSLQSNASLSEKSFLTVATGIDAIHDEVSQSVLQAVPSAAVSRRPTAVYDDETDEEDSEQHKVTDESVQAAVEPSADKESNHSSLFAKEEQQTSSEGDGNDNSSDYHGNDSSAGGPHESQTGGASVLSTDAEG
eukprot:gene7240-7453_t